MTKKRKTRPLSLFRVYCYCDRTRKTGGLNCECVDTTGKTILKAGEIVMKKGPTVR